MQHFFPKLQSNGIHENKKAPTEFSAGSGAKVVDLPRDASHEWQTTINSRGRRNSGCPFSGQTSAPELRIYAELQYLFAEVVNRAKINGQEDIFIPEINTAIEYDGYRWHRPNHKS